MGADACQPTKELPAASTSNLVADEGKQGIGETSPRVLCPILGTSECSQTEVGSEKSDEDDQTTCPTRKG